VTASVTQTNKQQFANRTAVLNELHTGIYGGEETGEISQAYGSDSLIKKILQFMPLWITQHFFTHNSPGTLIPAFGLHLMNLNTKCKKGKTDRINLKSVKFSNY
jgi:hypothetical protein